MDRCESAREQMHRWLLLTPVTNRESGGRAGLGAL